MAKTDLQPGMDKAWSGDKSGSKGLMGAVRHLNDDKGLFQKSNGSPAPKGDRVMDQGNNSRHKNTAGN